MVSVQYLDEEQIVITASKDGSVRLWTLTGNSIIIHSKLSNIF